MNRGSGLGGLGRSGQGEGAVAGLVRGRGRGPRSRSLAAVLASGHRAVIGEQDGHGEVSDGHQHGHHGCDSTAGVRGGQRDGGEWRDVVRKCRNLLPASAGGRHRDGGIGG